MLSVEITSAGAVALRDRPAPRGPAADGQVRVRMFAVSACGTDLSLAAGGRRPPRLPWRLGHEGIAEIAEVGPGVEGFAVGDRVALEPNITCGPCRHCTAGATSACVSRQGAGVATQPGIPAEVVDHPSEFCHRPAPKIPLERAVCAERLAVAAAAVRRSGIEHGQTALVFGADAQGLLAAMELVSQGCAVVVSAPDETRRALAVAIGARVFGAGPGSCGSPAPSSTNTRRTWPRRRHC